MIQAQEKGGISSGAAAPAPGLPTQRCSQTKQSCARSHPATRWDYANGIRAFASRHASHRRMVAPSSTRMTEFAVHNIIGHHYCLIVCSFCEFADRAAKINNQNIRTLPDSVVIDSKKALGMYPEEIQHLH